MTFLAFLQRAQIAAALGMVAALISHGMGADHYVQTGVAIVATALAGSAQVPA